jgi:hypothetical protein
MDASQAQYHDLRPYGRLLARLVHSRRPQHPQRSTKAVLVWSAVHQKPNHLARIYEPHGSFASR